MVLASRQLLKFFRKLLFSTSIIVTISFMKFFLPPYNTTLPGELGSSPQYPLVYYGQQTGLSRWYLTSHQSPAFQSGLSTSHVWPEEEPDDDRIEQQLSVRPGGTSTTKVILSNEHGVRTRPPSGERIFLKNNCPVRQCKITFDIREAEKADAILFKDWVDPSLLDSHIYKRPADQIWILSLLESPKYTKDYSNLNGHINWTATYRQDSELVTPYEKFVLYDPKESRGKQAANYAAQKTGKGKVAWFVSNCQTDNGRMDYAKELAKYIDVDMYGQCGSKTCDKTREKCEDVLRHDYKFYLSFENSNCLWYITEKFWMAIRSDVIPIAMGPPRAHYEATAPQKSFIHVTDFSGPKELAAYLHLLDQSESEYNAYFAWKGTGELIDTRFYCRLCALLHTDVISQKVYTDIQFWWAGPGVCSRTKSWVPQHNSLN